ncbi:MAG TPA: hypothetical protein V6C84_30085 [Coleofasciculaceae cyanobacterium]|jgi:hypothetical protein
MNTKLVESLVQIIRSLTPEERTILDEKLHDESNTPDLTASQGRSVPSGEPVLYGSKALDLLKFAGTWEGDDFEDCLQLVYETRSKAEF